MTVLEIIAWTYRRRGAYIPETRGAGTRAPGGADGEEENHETAMDRGEDGHDSSRWWSARPGEPEAALLAGPRGGLGPGSVVRLRARADAVREARGDEAADGSPGGALRPRQPPGQRRDHVAGEAHPGRRAGPPLRREHLGGAGRDDPGGDPGQERLSEGLRAVAPPEPSRGWDALPEVPPRRGQAPGGPRPDAVRPGLRPSGALPARVPGADLSHHAPRPRGRVPREAPDHRQLLR